MGIRQFFLGRRHGMDGIRHMAHRNMRPYDSKTAQDSYNTGYKVGYDQRAKHVKGPLLDYTNPINNKLFIDGA